MPEHTLRPAAAGDTQAIVSLVNSAYRGATSRAGWTTEADLLGGQRIDAKAISELLARPGSCVLVGELAGELRGCVHLEQKGNHAYLGMLTIRPTEQGSGLGRTLLTGAESWAREHWHVSAMEMTVIVQRAELIAWYERRGYERTGERRPFPYGDERFGIPRRDDLEFVVLRKTLG